MREVQFDPQVLRDEVNKLREQMAEARELAALAVELLADYVNVHGLRRKDQPLARKLREVFEKYGIVSEHSRISALAAGGGPVESPSAN